jgi:uncharacterized protein YegL
MRKKPTKTKPTRPTWAVLVLDETGSMSSCKAETISGYNAYVDALRKSKDMLFTLVKFDSISIKTVQDGVPIKEAIKLDAKNYTPGALTPLYDAVGKTIESTKEKKKDYDVLMVTLTDGLENASTKWSYEQIQHDIKKCEGEGWAFAHIGVGNQGWAAGEKLYAGTQSVNNVLRTDGKNVARSLARAGGQSVCYAAASMVGKEDLKADFFAGQKDDTEDTDE